VKGRVEEYELGVVGISLHFGEEEEEEKNVCKFLHLWWE